jgi:hypothetical protein
MPVFYRGPHGRITHQVIQVPQLRWREVALAELEQVRQVRSGPGPVVLRHRVLGTSALAGVFVTVPIAGQVSMLLAGVVAVALLVYAGACLRVRPDVHYELLAQCGAEMIVLVSTTDRRSFEQVSRALRRAVEFRDDTWR